MNLSHLSVLPLTLSEPYKNSVELMELNCGSLQKLTLTVRACNDLKAVFAQMKEMKLAELHLIIEEQNSENEQELMRLYQLFKHCDLLAHPLVKFSVAYHANNEDELHNSVRLMTLVGLLNQLNWDQCKNVVLDLHINYLHEDPRLDLIEELPVSLHITGQNHDEEEVMVDQAQLKMLAQSYAYLEGVF